MVTSLNDLGPKGFIDTSWDDAEFIDTPIGRACFIDVGDPENAHRALVALVDYAPGTIIPPHSHATDYTSVVVEGTIEVTRRKHGVGDIRVVKAGTVYGPLVAGPDGCKVIEIFADRSGILATYPKTDDPLSQKFIAMQDEYLQNQLRDLVS